MTVRKAVVKRCAECGFRVQVSLREPGRESKRMTLVHLDGGARHELTVEQDL